MGPYIQVATVCRDVSREQGTNSLTVTGFTTLAHIDLKGLPQDIQEPPIQLTLIATLWAGDEVGQHRVEIVPVAPNGQRRQPVESVVIDFPDAPMAGHDVILKFAISLPAGLNWFDVTFAAPDGSGERVIARIPLNVQYQR
jgi:hypothetical protein